MRCVETVSYFVILNRKLGDMFTHSRGLRQGDPLNPYLFLICNGLSILLKRESISDSLKGVRINRHAPHITQLLFADDSLIFGEISLEGAKALKEILSYMLVAHAS